MITKNQIKFIHSLEQKKIRKGKGLFVAEGKKIVNEILNSSLKIHSLYATKEFKYEPLLPLSGTASRFEKSEIEENDLKKISFLTTPNEVLCIAEIPKHKIDFNQIRKQLSLLLDNIKDPGNLGNIFRIADWFGIENIFCSPGCVDAYNPKAVQATMGSIARVKIIYEEPENIIGELKKSSLSALQKKEMFPVYACTLNGKNIYKENLSSNGLIILGNESEGISEKLLQLADLKISIPPFGKAESLNVAASAGVICSEFRRKT